jgi:L-2-hydroxyglutarate oxidase LhgO
VTESVDVAVIGAGVVGLAVARAMALQGREVVVLEAHDAIGTETSSRNSEVIHAGLYYATGSLKARLCVAGRERLYAYCAAHGVGHRRCGKLVVATDDTQLPALQALQRQAQDNGVHDVARLDEAHARQMEPALRCVAALHSPSTGIVDSHGLMLALRGDAESRGAMLAFRSPVERGRAVDRGVEIEVGGEDPMRLLARTLVNSAGLHAAAVARRIEGMDLGHVPPAHRCKGTYFALSGRAPFSRLVYPMHDHAGLGVHITLDLAGQARFGPDTEWLDDDGPLDYRVDPQRAAGFEAAIRRYWPGLPDHALVPAYSDIRPKVAGPGEPPADWVVQGARDHGVAGLVNLFGIESPGLTACLALADHVAAVATQ